VAPVQECGMYPTYTDLSPREVPLRTDMKAKVPLLVH